MAIIPIVVKASVLLTAALLGARLLRSAAAGTRHAVWSVTFAALLALPLVGATVPAVHIPIPAAWAASLPSELTSRSDGKAVTDLKNVSAIERAPGPETVPDRTTSVPSPEIPAAGLSASAKARPAGESASGSGRTFSAWTLVRSVWIAGTFASVGTLLLSLVRVRRLARRATAVSDPAWHDAVRAIGARLALRGPARVLVSDAVRTPMAGGLWRPVIFLPADAASWSAERRDVVLAHELSHIAGRDPLRHVAARLAVACYWFHPLAWIAARQSTLAREQACDEAVLALGIRPSEYARVLLELADTMTPCRRAAAALPMVERSLLETRLMAILDHSTRPSRLRPIVPAACAASLALILAAAQPAARSIDVRSPAPVTPAAASPPAAVPPSPSPAVPSAPQTRLYTTCSLDFDRGDFSGFTTSYTNTDERGTVVERVGRSSGALIIQRRLGEMAICMFAEDHSASAKDTPSAWAGRAPRVIIETQRGAASRVRLDILRPNGETQTTYRVNGADRPFDAAAQAWRDAVLAVLDRTWEISTLRGRESTLYGEISTLRGEESTLHGEISSLRGQISTMRGEQSSVRGEESMLRGEISTILGQASSLLGQIASERGAISSLEASRFGTASVDRERLAAEIAAHQKEIARLEREMRDSDEAARIAAVEKQIRTLDAEGKVAAIDDQIRKFDEAGKIAAIEKQIQALNVEGKAADLERQISGLDVDRRTRQMQAALDEALKRLEQALAAIR